MSDWIDYEEALTKFGITSNQLHQAIKLGLVKWKPVEGPTIVSEKDVEQYLTKIKTFKS